MQMFNNIFDFGAVLIFLIGVFDCFRIYLRVFRRSGGFENFLFSHVSATMIGFLRIIPYALAAALILVVSNVS